VRETVVILHQVVDMDAGPDELDVLDQVECVERELRCMGFRVHAMPFDLDRKNMLGRIRKHHPACVFNLVETVMGDGRLAHLTCSYLDHLGMPYTGAGTDAMHLTSNKVLAKRWMKLSGIPTPEWLAPGGPQDALPPFPSTCIVKPVWEDASVGISPGCVLETHCSGDLAEAVSRMERTIKKPCFAECYIEGREFNLSLLARDGGVEALPPAEISFDLPEGMPRIVDYRAKWTQDSPEYRGTSRVQDFPPEDSPMLDGLEELALRCWDCFDLRGYARVDIRVDKGGAPYVLEVNANPCISPDSGFCAAAEKAGITLGEIVSRLVKDAMRTRGHE
jgi:D-alanine-D-alanine ligase